MEPFDLFISYRRKDADRVLPLVDALRGHGLNVWLDQRDIGDFAAITGDIRTGLANSKALLAWYSADYPRSRPCQMELTAAFIAAQQAGDPRQRILVINPERDASHVLPVQLADEQHVPAGDVRDLSARIAAHVTTLQAPLGALLPLQPPPQYGRLLAGAARFIGRLPDLWRLHSALTASDSAIINQSYGPGLALVSGLGGAGKSLLAEEYALRFAAAYPGGIFWLRALGNDGSRPALSAEDQEALRSGQSRNVAIGLGVPVQGLNPAEVDAALARKLAAGASFLWIVDDLAAGLDDETVRRWLAPAPPGRTLITTRSRKYGAIGRHVPLDMLDPAEAFELLCARRVPTGTAEEEAARALARDLGFHPLALEVAGAALKADEGLRTFGQLRAELSNPSHDELEPAADPQIVGTLPSGHEPSVARTLLRSVLRLGSEGQDFLRLAASLAVAPIPASLVLATLAHVDDLDDREARDRTRKALAQIDSASLTTDAGEGARLVHALVSRTVRLRDPDTVRVQALSRSAIAALSKALAAAADVRSHPSIALEVLHAREISARGLADAVSATLAEWVARYDFERGVYAAAQTLQEQILDIRRRVQGDEHPDTFMSLGRLAETLRAQGDLTAARALQETLLADRRRVLGDEHPDTFLSMNNLAVTLSDQGDLAGARALHETVLAGWRRVQGDEHPDTLRSMNNLAATLFAQGDLAGARALQETVLAGRRRVLGDEHPDTFMSMNNLAAMLSGQGDLAGARALQETVLATSRRVLGDEHPHTLTSMNNLAETLSDQGDLAGARALQETVLAGRRRVLGDEHPDTFMSMNNLAAMLRAQGDLPAARALQETLLADRRRVLSDEHPATTVSAWILHATLLEIGDAEAAGHVLRDALAWLISAEGTRLSADQQQIREQLVRLQAQSARPWWRRWWQR